MLKEQLIKLIQEQVPDGESVVLSEVSYDGTPNFRNIKEIEYEGYNKVYIIK